MTKASATSLLLLVILGRLGSAHRAEKPQPLEASDKSAEAAGAMPTETLLAEKATEVPKPADAVVGETAPADKSSPAAAALSALPTATVPALRGTAPPEAMGTAIPAAHAGAAEAPAPPVDAPMVSAGSTEKTSGLISTSIVQQGAVATAFAPQDTAAASERDSIATTLEAFCGRWVEDKGRRSISSGYFELADLYEDHYWLDKNGVLCQTIVPGEIEKLQLDRPQIVLINGDTYIETNTFQHGHIITTDRDPTEQEADSVLGLRMDTPVFDMFFDRWIDINDKLHSKTMAYDSEDNLHTFTVISNRKRLEI